MSDADRMTLRQTDIGRRFLDRTSLELERSRELLRQYHVNPDDSLAAIRHLAHKIGGSGALFGFSAISDCALLLERLAAGLVTIEQFRQLEAGVDALALQVEADLRGAAVAA